MRDLFPGHYRPDVSTLRQMMQSATVILDSSSLLNLYRYPEKARKDLLAVLYKFSDRLWIPYQVALEFQENRLSVISDQVSRFKEVKDITAKLENTAKTQLDKLQLDKRHSSIDPRSFISKVSRAAKEFAELAIHDRQVWLALMAG